MTAAATLPDRRPRTPDTPAATVTEVSDDPTELRPVTAGALERYVAQLAATDGVSLPGVRWRHDVSSGQAIRRRGRDVIVFGDGVLADTADAHFTAAHEMGHIVLGHTRRAWRVAVLYIGSGLLAIAAAAALAVATLGTGAVGLGPLGAVVWLLVQPPLLRRLKHPAEYAADRYAADRGQPLTAELAARYESRATGSKALRWLFPMHPSWSDRVAAIGRTTS